MPADTPPAPYHGRTAALATLHGKAHAIAAPLLRRLGLVVAAVPIDTDAFGTFTGEVARAGTARDAALTKARAGMAAAGLPLGLASEGSFGPHPWLPFGAGGVETLAFVDAERGLELVETQVSRRTNYARHDLRPGADLAAWLGEIGFPTHGLIVRAPDGTVLAKGVQDANTLAGLLPRAAQLETDMRAHMNPTRMAAIRRLAGRLAARLATPCPTCGGPGYGQTGVESGLPCAACGSETGLVRALVFGCALCGQSEKRPRPDGRSVADPDDCPKCNP